MSHPLVYASPVAALRLQGQSWAVAETVRPVRTKTFTVWPFTTGRVCQPLSWCTEQMLGGFLAAPPPSVASAYFTVV